MATAARPRVDQSKVIAYYRVSTERQGQSGLGLEAQETAVRTYAEANKSTIVHSYKEVESGGDSDRPELARALAHAKMIGATLVIAKLDRLTRDTEFLLGLVNAGAELAFCELPQIPPGPMGRFFLTMMAAVAELERGLISQRTRAALAAFKASVAVPKRLREQYPDGVPPELIDAYAGKLGSHRPGAFRLTGGRNLKAARRAGQVAAQAADSAYVHLAGTIAAGRAAGRSLREIAAALNAEGHRTRGGKPWNAMQVKRVLDRTAAAAD